MERIISVIAEKVTAAFLAAGYEDRFGAVKVSDRPDLCQYQCNGAMAAAKQYHKAPILIANEIVKVLADDPLFSQAEAVAPGFINLSVGPEFLADYVSQMQKEPKFGLQTAENPQTVVVDYGGANVAKPLHVGHMRPAVIGEAVKRILRYAGHKVIGDAHLGDWGTPIGLIITELKVRQPDLVYFDPDYTGEYPKEAPFDVSELEEIYPYASKWSKEHEDYREESRKAILELQQGRRGYMALWEHIMRVSMADLKKAYDNLGTVFDIWGLESDAQKYIPDMVKDMKDKGYAHLSEGALVVDVKEETDTKEMPPCMIFEQIFRCAKKCGLVKPETGLVHIGFGTMTGKDGKPFKTRDGGVMRLSMLIDLITEEVRSKMADREMPEEERDKIAKQIGLAALKYGDLSNQPTKDYIFDIERFTSFEGNTGPYILYTMVRIKSILSKLTDAPNAAHVAGREYGPEESALLLTVARFADSVEKAVAELSPMRICQYIYELADCFNGFYHANKIVTEPDEAKKADWIALLKTTLGILNDCIEMLAFEAPDKM